MKSFLERFMPFLVIGVAIVVGIIGIFLLSYVIIWGAVVAGILYLITWVSNKFKKLPKKDVAHKEGRTIEHEK